MFNYITTIDTLLYINCVKLGNQAAALSHIIALLSYHPPTTTTTTHYWLLSIIYRVPLIAEYMHYNCLHMISADCMTASSFAWHLNNLTDASMNCCTSPKTAQTVIFCLFPGSHVSQPPAACFSHDPFTVPLLQLPPQSWPCTVILHDSTLTNHWS